MYSFFSEGLDQGWASPFPQGQIQARLSYQAETAYTEESETPCENSVYLSDGKPGPWDLNLPLPESLLRPKAL